MPGERPLPRLARQLPWPWRAAVGVVLTALGLWLVTRPVSSLTLLVLYLGATLVVVGVGDLLAARGDRSRRAVGLLWVAIGVGALVAPGWSAAMLPPVIAVALAVSGALRLVRARSGPSEDRWASGLIGLTELVLAALALLVPDVTLVVVAVLFGVRAAVVGVQLLWDAVSRRDAEREVPEPGEGRTRAARRRRLVASASGLALAVAVLAGTTLAKDAKPSVDDFYDPDGISVADRAEPGRLLRYEEFTSEVPDAARAWRILYSTVDVDGAPTTASGIVMVPRADPLTGGRPVVAPDYVGLGGEGTHAYLVGNVAGTAVLDAVRAARGLSEAHVSDDTVVWGHSQGGAAALWTAQVQPEHAPDVPLLGTVAMAPASDVPSLADGLADVTGGSVFAAFVAVGYAAAYDDVRLRDAVRTPALPLVERMASRCLSEPGVLASVLTALSLQDEDVLRADATRGAMGARLSQNVPLRPGSSPVWVAQGADDPLITPELQGSYVQRVRRGGGEIDFTVLDGLDHLTLVQEGSALLPQLLEWTSDRFAGQ